MLGHRTVTELLTFSVSCAAVEQLTRVLALTLAPKSIRVNALAVGDPAEAVLGAAPPGSAAPGESARFAPLGRRVEPQECAEVALFPASPAASFVTCHVLAVDGGRALVYSLAARG